MSECRRELPVLGDVVRVALGEEGSGCDLGCEGGCACLVRVAWCEGENNAHQIASLLHFMFADVVYTSFDCITLSSSWEFP